MCRAFTGSYFPANDSSIKVMQQIRLARSRTYTFGERERERGEKERVSYVSYDIRVAPAAFHVKDESPIA